MRREERDRRDDGRRDHENREAIDNISMRGAATDRSARRARSRASQPLYLATRTPQDFTPRRHARP